MDARAEIRDFLVTRRARLRPEQAGVPEFGGGRRVPGLRREEVAHLAGVSVDYYNRLERGTATGISPQVLDAVARALQLDVVEREHLADLFAALQPHLATPRRRRARQPIRPTVQAVLDSSALPAFVQTSRLEIVAANALAIALYSTGGDPIVLPFSTPRFLFLDPRGPEFYRDWSRAARNQVALLRGAAGRDPDDSDLMALIGELSTRSAPFRELWASHGVLKRREGRKRYRHPLVGDVDFVGESFLLDTDGGLTFTMFTFEARSSTAEAMALLASWSMAGAIER